MCRYIHICYIKLVIFIGLHLIKLSHNSTVVKLSTLVNNIVIVGSITLRVCNLGNQWRQF